VTSGRDVSGGGHLEEGGAAARGITPLSLGDNSKIDFNFVNFSCQK
jgi:hypothetical protein